MDVDPASIQKISWRWPAALSLFLLAMLGLLSGVSLTERPEVADADLLTKAYYSLGLFVVGGLDIGTPVGGPGYGRTMLWIAYFGAPVFTATAVIEALVRIVSPAQWQIRRLRNHIVVVGSGRLAGWYLRALRRSHPTTRVVVVDLDIDSVREQELRQTYGARVVSGDIGQQFMLGHLKLKKARRVMLLGGNDFEAFEAVHQIAQRYPRLKSKMVLRCQNLRFLRTMQDAGTDALCESFNTYHLAATGLVRDQMIAHFKETAGADVVVMAGFGRFGQAILEELRNQAPRDIETVAVIDRDANRRILVAEEQERLGQYYRREVFQGDIAHPEVWNNLRRIIDLDKARPTIILGTGNTEENLRTALWLKARHPNTVVYTRTNDTSALAMQMGAEHGIHAFSIAQLVEDNIPERWLD